MMLNPENLNKMIRAIMETREEEIGCDECFEQLDLFVETKLSGLDAAAAMPLVQNHLDKCGDCREEFEALLTALHATEDSSPHRGNVLGVLRRLWLRIRRASGT